MNKKILITLVASGALALQVAALADNVFVTNDGTHPVPVTGSDVTVNTTVDLTHIISVPGATPSPSPAKAMAVQGIANATAVGVSMAETAVTVAISSVTTGATISAGKHHIEFVLSSDFAGTVGGVTISPSDLKVYSLGTTPPGYKFPAVSYTISAGSAVLTTW